MAMGARAADHLLVWSEVRRIVMADLIAFMIALDARHVTGGTGDCGLAIWVCIPVIKMRRVFIVPSVLIIVTLNAGFVGGEGARLVWLMASGAVHLEVSCRFFHRDARHGGSHGREPIEGESHAVLTLLEFLHVFLMARGAVLGRGPRIGTEVLVVKFWQSGIGEHFSFSVMFEKIAGCKWGVIVVVMTASGGAGVVGQIFVRFEIL